MMLAAHNNLLLWRWGILHRVTGFSVKLMHRKLQYHTKIFTDECGRGADQIERGCHTKYRQALFKPVAYIPEFVRDGGVKAASLFAWGYSA